MNVKPCRSTDWGSKCSVINKEKMSQIKMSKFVTNFTIKNSKVIFVKNQTLILVRFDYMAIKTFQMVETASNFVS